MVLKQLDKLSGFSKEEDQQPIFEKFYERMNAEELMWLIRMILRQMKIGRMNETKHRPLSLLSIVAPSVATPRTRLKAREVALASPLAGCSQLAPRKVRSLPSEMRD